MVRRQFVSALILTGALLAGCAIPGNVSPGASTLGRSLDPNLYSNPTADVKSVVNNDFSYLFLTRSDSATLPTFVYDSATGKATGFTMTGTTSPTRYNSTL